MGCGSSQPYMSDSQESEMVPRQEKILSDLIEIDMFSVELTDQLVGAVSTEDLPKLRFKK